MILAFSADLIFTKMYCINNFIGFEKKKKKKRKMNLSNNKTGII